jgi:hypothetical protein
MLSREDLQIIALVSGEHCVFVLFRVKQSSTLLELLNRDNIDITSRSL